MYVRGQINLRLVYTRIECVIRSVIYPTWKFNMLVWTDVGVFVEESTCREFAIALAAFPVVRRLDMPTTSSELHIVNLSFLDA